MSTIFGTFRRLLTLCCAFILPVIFAIPNSGGGGSESSLDRRSLSNYVTTSVPYVVDDHRNKHISVADRVKEILKQNTRNRTRDTFDRTNSSSAAAAAIGATTDHAASVEGTFKPYSQGELNKILQKYENERDGAAVQESNKVANYYSFNGNVDNRISSSSSTAAADDSNDKSKAWNVISYSQNTINKNPYDDRLGWVTLEPIAWSSSQVQKWEPNTKPNWPLPLSDNGAWGSSQHFTQQHNAYNGYPAAERPYKRPTYQYQSKPWSSFGKPQNSPHYANEEIITDGQPGYFPSDRPSHNSYRPWVEQTQSISYTDTSNHPSTHVVYQGIGTVGHNHHVPEREPTSASSAEGDGHWVLLSSSKGYSVPHRHRSGFGTANDGNDSVNEETKTATSNRQTSVRSGRVIDIIDSNGKSLSSTAASNVIEIIPVDLSENETYPTRVAKQNTNFESMTTKNDENLRI